jgi:hypothetical protein
MIVALGAAACGDDVTVTEQTPATPVVRSVVVSPSAATIATGGAFTFGAAVEADAGLATTVNWTSSNTAVATVANGVATAAGAGVTSICATSTVDANKASCAQLTVTAAPAPQPATVEIDAITVGCDAISNALSPVACGLNTPVATNNVFGEFQVQANVNRPQGSAVTGVRLEVINAATGIVEATSTQTLSQDVSGAEGLAAQVAANRVTFSVQSAAYTKTATAATVRHVNGQKRIRVSLIGGGATASADRDLTFRNANGFHIESTTDLSSTALNANGVNVRQTSAGGFSWVGGTGLTMTIFPVSYTGVAANTATIAATFGQGCDLALGNRTVATTVVGGVSTGTLAYTNGGAAAAGNLNGYEFNPACGGNGEVPSANAVDANGNPFINIVLGGNFGATNTLNNQAGAVEPGLTTVPALRVDNRGPQGAYTITNLPNNRALGWMNDAVTLTAANTGATSNGIRTASPVDAGFGGTVSYSAHTGASTLVTAATCAGSVPANLPGATSTAGLAESLTPATYCLVQQAMDTFRNRVLSNLVTIGVDRTVPLMVNNGSPADQAIVDVTAAEAFGVSASDALSGFPAAGAIQHSLVRVNGAAGGVLARVNVVGGGTASATPFAALAAGTTINTPAAAAYVPAPTVITGTPVALGAAAASGYYLYQARATDNAGNQSLFFTRRFYVNNGGIPNVTGLNATLTYTGGAPAAFPGAADDLVEVVSGELRLAYPNAGDLIYNRASPTVDAMWDDNIAIPVSVPFSVPAFIRGIQNTAAGVPVADFATAKPNAVRGRVYNGFGTSIVGAGFLATAPAGVGASGFSADFTAPILPTQIANGTDFTTVPVATRTNLWQAGAQTCSTAGTTRTCFFDVTARGLTGSYLNPFASIAVAEALTGTTNWRVVSGPGAVALPGLTVTVAPQFTAPFPTLDNGVNRDFVWRVTVARSPVPAVGAFDYAILGITSGFDALATVRATVY